MCVYIYIYIFFFFFLVGELPWWLSGKESTCNAGEVGLIPGSGRSPGEGRGYSCVLPGQSHGQRRPAVHGVVKSQTRLKSLSACVCFAETAMLPRKESSPRERFGWRGKRGWGGSATSGLQLVLDDLCQGYPLPIWQIGSTGLILVSVCLFICSTQDTYCMQAIVKAEAGPTAALPKLLREQMKEEQPPWHSFHCFPLKH